MLGEMKSPVASMHSADVQSTQSNVQGPVPSWKAFLTSARLTSESLAQEENALEQAIPKTRFQLMARCQIHGSG